MASTFLTRTIATATSTKIGTFSCWVKRANLTDGRMFSSWGSGTSQFWILFQNDTISIADYDGSYNLQYVTNRLFRDTSAWYHILVAFDTTQGTSGDRVKLYVNGVQETSFSTSTAPSQNQVLNFSNSGEEFRIGKRDSEEYLDGLMSHIHFVDGTALTPATFGETDSTSGIWKPKASPSGITYGNNGFFLKFENSGAMGTDSSGESNTFTVSGTITQNVDTPSNNFCTMNPLRPNGISQTYSNGNNTFIRTGTGGQMNGTLGVMSGKWYYECLIDDYWQYLGWTIPTIAGQTTACSDSGSGFYGLYSNASALNTYANGTGTSQGSYTAMASGQIWGIAFDADNAKMYFSVNGVWENSSNPANQTNPAMSSIPVTDFLVPAIGQGTGSRSSTIKLNFGSGYFGTTAVASANADANGHGKMEYAVPSGFYTLNTKNIKEFG